jgi:protein arginine kinase
MDLNEFDTPGGEWLKADGADADVVMSSRVRLARNLAGFPFSTRATDDQRTEILARMKSATSGLAIGPRRYFVDLASGAADELGDSKENKEKGERTEKSERRPAKEREIDRMLLHERHLISTELEKGKGPRGVAFGSDERVSVMVNEEDHLRMQAIRSGFSLDAAFADAKGLDVTLESLVSFAVSPTYGYLTACPTNVGTGLRASVMLHLPALVYAQEMNRVFQAATRTGLAVRGFYGEGTKAMGDFYQISNQQTLGQSEEEILRKLARMLPTFLEYERKVREHLLSNSRVKLEDKILRALAVLRIARIVSTDDAMEMLSAVRLGVVTGIVPGIELPRIHELFALVQPAHLRRRTGRTLEAALDRDIERASLLRERLAG